MKLESTQTFFLALKPFFMFSAAKPLSIITYFHSTLRALFSTTTTTTTMAASKFLIALMLVLAITGSAQAQTMTPAEKAIIAACGIPAAIKIKSLSPSCMTALATAKTCPKNCVTLIKEIKTPACGAALNKVTSVANQKKIAKVSR